MNAQNIRGYLEIDWEATGLNLTTLLSGRASVGALAEWFGVDEQTTQDWMRNPGHLGIERLLLVAKFLNMDVSSILVTKGQQEPLDLLGDYFDAKASATSFTEQHTQAPTCCTTAQQLLEKALYNELTNRLRDLSPTKTLEEFLLYLPLFDQSNLADFMSRTIGDVYHNREYVYEQVDSLIRSIPVSTAKQYADKMRYFCLCEPNVHHVSDSVINDVDTASKLEEYLAYLRTEDFNLGLGAYTAACFSASKRFAYLHKLKAELENMTC